MYSHNTWSHSFFLLFSLRVEWQKNWFGIYLAHRTGKAVRWLGTTGKKNRINGIELRDGRWKMWWGQEKREYDISKDIWAVFLVDFFSNMREKTSTRALCDKIDTIGEILSLLSEDSMFCEFDSAFMTCASCLYDISEAIDQQWKIFRTKGWTIVISIAKS